MKTKREKITGACFWFVFVLGYDVDHAKTLSNSLENWQLDEMADNGSKAWKYLERAILNNIGVIHSSPLKLLTSNR